MTGPQAPDVDVHRVAEPRPRQRATGPDHPPEPGVQRDLPPDRDRPRRQRRTVRAQQAGPEDHAVGQRVPTGDAERERAAVAGDLRMRGGRVHRREGQRDRAGRDRRTGEDVTSSGHGSPFP